MNYTKRETSFNANGLKVAALLFVPEGAEGKKNKAIICVHPGNSCKEQTAGLYASKLAENGFVAMSYDATYQGASEGEPHFLENPAARVEDIRCAVDYLMTLDFVDEEKIGIMGVCAGGGYAVNASMTERRIKAVASVAGVNYGRSQRGTHPIEDLEAIAKQRTAEARGEAMRVDAIIPGSPEECAKLGITDVDIVGAVDYYTTPRGYAEGSGNRIIYSRIDAIYAFDAYHLADILLTQPLQIITPDVKGAFDSVGDGKRLYEMAASEHKDLYILENTTHYDLYDQPKAVDPAVKKLTEFYNLYL